MKGQQICFQAYFEERNICQRRLSLQMLGMGGCNSKKPTYLAGKSSITIGSMMICATDLSPISSLTSQHNYEFSAYSYKNRR